MKIKYKIWKDTFLKSFFTTDYEMDFQKYLKHRVYIAFEMTYRVPAHVLLRMLHFMFFFVYNFMSVNISVFVLLDVIVSLWRLHLFFISMILY